MTQKNRQFIEKAVNVSSNTMVCSVAISVLLLGVWLFLYLGSTLHVLPDAWRLAAGSYIKLSCLITCAIGGFFFVLYLTLKIIFKINDDFELRDQALSPLINVSSKQEKAIIRILIRAATRSDGSDKINRSEVANFLATLKVLGVLNDGGDLNNLRLWVEKETDLYEPDKGHFAEAYNRAIVKKGDTRYTKDLKEIIEKSH